jgi:hypothetical protein
MYGRVLSGVMALMLLGATAWATPNFSKSRLVTIKYAYNGRQYEKSVTAMPDYQKPTRWYYVPNQPYIVKDAKGRPEFILVKHQYRGKNADGDYGIHTRAIMQFSFTLGLPQPAHKALRAYCVAESMKKKTVGGAAQGKPTEPIKEVNPADVKLVMVPITKSDVKICSPLSGEVIYIAVPDDMEEGFIGPAFGSQKMPVTVELKGEETAAIIEELINKGGGIPLFVSVTFPAITSPCGGKAEINWDSTYNCLSADVRLRGAVQAKAISAEGTVGAGFINRELERNSALKITFVEGEAERNKREGLESIMKDLIDRMYENMYDKDGEPQRCEPARLEQVDNQNFTSEMMENLNSARDLGAFKRTKRPRSQTTKSDGTTPRDTDAGQVDMPMKVGGKISFEAVLRNEHEVKKGKETIDYNIMQCVDRRTMVAGFVSLRDYTAVEREKLVTIVPYGTYEKGYLPLPAYSADDDEMLNIKLIELSVSIVPKDDAPLAEQVDTQTVYWQGGNWYVNKGNENEEVERGMLQFPLTAIKENLKRKMRARDVQDKKVIDALLKDARYRIYATFEYRPSWSPHRSITVHSLSHMPLVQGGMPVAKNSNFIKVWFVNAAELVFWDDDDVSPLGKMRMTAKYDMQEWDKSFKLKKKTGRASMGLLDPETNDSRSVAFLVPAECENVTLDVKWQTPGKKKADNDGELKGIMKENHKKWPFARKNLLEEEEFMDGDVFLTNNMWLKEDGDLYEELLGF